MSKERKSNREVKKQPMMSPKERKAAKKSKKDEAKVNQGRTSPSGVFK
jgi:hypothetical protein